MVLGNQNLITSLQSRVVTKEEFDFDHLTARPLYSMLTSDDINQLYTIAHSVRYAGKAPLKMKKIDEIMHNRGFKKLSAGTNRICYTYFEDPTIVVKVAFDDIGRHDNPKEFLNQMKLKPFCTKCFEVSPDGSVAVFERVEPITNVEEFISISDRVLKLLDIITSRYIMADIGASTFMNFGLRNRFGPVLLDYPYLYEPDIQKLVCKVPNPSEPAGICGGFIDYDDGYDNLICTKCGATYKASELGQSLYVKENSTIVRKGRNRMIVNFRYNGVQVAGGNSEDNKVDKEFTQKITPVIRNGQYQVPTYQDGVRTDMIKNPINVSFSTADPKSTVVPKVKYSTNNTKPNNQTANKKYSNNIRVKTPVNSNNSSNGNSPQHNSNVKLTAIRFDELPNVSFNFDNYDGNILHFFAPFSNDILRVNIIRDNIPEDVRAEIAPESEELIELRSLYETAKTDILKLEKDVEKYKAKAGSAYQEKKEAQEALLAVQLGENNTTPDNTKILELENAITQRDNKIQELEAKLKGLDEDETVESLKSSLNILGNENTDLQNSYNALKDEYDKIKDNTELLKQSEEKVKELTGKLAVQEGLANNYTEMSNNYNELADKLQVSESESKEKDQKIAEKDKTIGALTIQLKNAQLDLENANSNNSKLEEEKLNVEIKNEELEEEVKDLRSKIDELNEELESYEEEEPEEYEDSESEEEEVNPYIGYNFIKGALYSADKLAAMVNMENPTINNSNKIIVMLTKEGEFATDLGSNIIAIESIGDIPLDNIVLKQQVVVKKEESNDESSESNAINDSDGTN